MVDRIRWQAVAHQQAVGLRSKINLTIDLSPDTPGERSEIELALRSLFPKGFNRAQARWFMRGAIEAVSRAVIKDGKGFFPMEVALQWNQPGPELSAPRKIVLLELRREHPSA